MGRDGCPLMSYLLARRRPRQPLLSPNRDIVIQPAYIGARPAAAAVEAFLRRSGPLPSPTGGARSSRLDSDAIAGILDAAFWASLRKEEGRSPRISLAFIPPEETRQPLRFQYPLPLLPEFLTRLAPAVDRPGIHLGVWRDGGDLQVWGATVTLPANCPVFEVVEPGLIVIKYRRGEGFGKYGNIAVLRGDQLQVVDEAASSLPDCAELIHALRGFEAPATWTSSGHELVRLAIAMREHGRGGLLLVVPDGGETWRESIIGPILYSITPPFSRLAGLLDRAPDEQESAAWQDATRRLIDGVAGVTAVDGAAVLTDSFELLAFGAKIGRRESSTPVGKVMVTEPVIGNRATPMSPSQLGGTRHLSAAQFVHDQQGSLALVASQDGRFTVFAWSPCEAMVHAHRVETLLL